MSNPVGYTKLGADAAIAAAVSPVATEVAQEISRAQSAEAAKADAATVTAALTAKADLVGGVIPTAQIPALALTNTVTVASQTAMLALTASQMQPGDLAVRTDGAGTFALTGADPSQLSNWVLLNAPTDKVVSVNGQTGTVVLSAANVGADTSGAATTAQAYAVQRANHTGTQSADTLTDGTTNKAYTATERTKLAAATSLDTTRVPSAAGTGTAGTGTAASPSDHVHPRSFWTPEDHGFISWSFDPILNSGSAAPTAGQLYLARLHVPVATTITNLALAVNTAGSGLTAGQNFAGLFDTNRYLLAATADQSTVWNSIGLKVMPLATPQAVTAGDYYLGFFATGTTIPSFLRVTNNFMANANLAAANARFAHADTGLTTALPTRAVPFVLDNIAWWAGIS